MTKKYITQYPSSIAEIPAETKYLLLYDNSFSEYDGYADRYTSPQYNTRYIISVMAFASKLDLMAHLESNKDKVSKMRVIPWGPAIAAIKHTITIEGLDNV